MTRNMIELWEKESAEMEIRRWLQSIGQWAPEVEIRRLEQSVVRERAAEHAQPAVPQEATYAEAVSQPD